MRIRSISAAALLLCALAISGSASSKAGAQTARPRPKIQTNTAASYQYAYQHGYRAGYEDGFERGKNDFAASRARDFQSSDAYTRADRGYRDNMGGSLPEFQEGYRIGFEVAYNDGYYGRPYSISMPTNLGRAVIATLNANRPNYANNGANPPANTYPNDSRPRTADNRADDRRVDDRRNEERPSDYRTNDGRNGAGQPARASGRGGLIVRNDMSMKVRLNTGIDTKTSREGDPFTAVVLDGEYADAELTGHIAKLTRSGKATGKTELALAFDSIRLRDGRAGRFNAQVERVYESETVKTVDEEGNVESSSRTKDTATRGVGGAALGAIIGGIAGGGKGAAIGAILGGGVGAGSVYVQDGKSLRLEPGTEMLIRTTGPAER